MAESNNLRVHPAADIFPMMSDEELADLAEDIKANGLVHPLIVDANNQLIDGRNRWAACKLAGITPRFEQLNGHDPLAFIASANLKRRNLTKGQQAMAEAMIYPDGIKGKKRSSQSEHFSKARLSQARSVLHHNPDLASSVLAGITPLNDALEQVKASQSRLSSDAVKIERLEAEAPDLAELVREGRLQVSVAIAELEQRIINDHNARRSATRALNAVLTALEPGESSPQEVANKWTSKLDFSIEPYPLPLTRHRLERSLEVIASVITHLMKGQ